MTINWLKSTYPYCGLGSGLMISIEEGRIVKICGMKGHPSNNGEICQLPFNYPPIITDMDRLMQPLIKLNGQNVPISWDEAIKTIADSLLK